MIIKEGIFTPGIKSNNSNSQNGSFQNLLSTIGRFATLYTSTPSQSNISDIVPTTNWVNSFVNNYLPTGSIIMWNGNDIPNGWALCDGTNGTPNLTGRFVLGFQYGTYDINSTGGSSTVTLNIDEIPAHTHDVNDPGHNHQVELKTESMQNVGGEGESVLRDRESSNKNTTTNLTGITLQETGGSGSHENMPPYYVLAYIMKI